MNLLDKDDNLLIDAFGVEDLAAEDDGQSPGTNSVTNGPSDWNNVSPNQVMARLKLLKAEVLEQHDLHPFYKSYTTWEKMTREQQNKAVAWFRKLPDHLKVTTFTICFLCFYFTYSSYQTNTTITNLILFLYVIAVILETARAEEEKASEVVATTAAVMTKDDVARLIHLFKFPSAQVHWTNHYGVLNRAQLDACRTSGAASEAANPLSCLAEIFNDYEEFQLQNEMGAYEQDPATGTTCKKSPWEPSGEEWEELSIQTYDIEPTNLARCNIYRDAAWIKSIWNDVKKYLYQVFVQYNRSGQCSGDMGEWCSPEEQQRWVRAAFWKGGSTNTIVRFPTVMIYSIAMLEQGDFEGIGRAMPKGTGADNSIAEPDAENETAQAKRKRKKRGPYDNVIIIRAT
jgi:hypothetical protein